MRAAQNSNGNSKGKKVVGKPFQKGKSGNPGGRPKTKAVREVILEHSAKGGNLTKLVKRLYKDYPLSYLAYGWGKPVETHNVTLTQEVAGVPPEMLEVLRERFMATVAPNRN